jgi:galactose mutarotase-like enzyme
MHVIENEYLRIKAREYGGELTSIYNLQTGIEHLWLADPDIWGWHAPVLFPVVGRCFGDEIKISGNRYPMEKHGFARKSEFKLMELSESRMVFALLWSEETLAQYPYKFEFLISYRLKDDKLIIGYEVINKDDKPISFQIGGHPAFAVPFKKNEKYEDYSVSFEWEETVSRHLINEDGYFTGKTELVLQESQTIPLTSTLFDRDALIFKDHRSRKVTIENKKNDHFLSVFFNGFTSLGIWAKPNANYVCIEPWLGYADTQGKLKEFSLREGTQKIGPGAAFNLSYRIEVG